MPGDLPANLYKPEDKVPDTPTPNKPNFLEQHGTVVLLYSLVIIGMAATFYLGMRTKIDPEKVFAYFSGFGSGAFSALALAMRVNGGSAK